MIDCDSIVGNSSRSAHSLRCSSMWKMSKTVEGLEKKSTRMGTYDANLNRIGD